MSLARSLADLISGNAVIEATEIADNTITGGKLATDIVINTTGTASLATSSTCVNKVTIGTGPFFDSATLRVADTTNGGSLLIRGGGPRLYFDGSSGYVGGTTSATFKPTIYMDSRGLVFRQGMCDTCFPSLYIHCNNNIGIGTTAPNADLHIVIAADPTLTLEDSVGDNQSRMRFLTATKCFTIGLHGGESKFRISAGTVFGASCDWFSVCNTGQVDVTCNLVIGGTLTSCGLSYPTADGTSGQVIQTDGAGNLTFATVSGGGGLADVVDDTTPQLGGNLDLNGNNICGLGQICILGEITVSDGTTCHQIGTSGCNIYFGGNALASLTSGTLNTAMGFNALCSVTTGTRHIAIGADAGTSMTGGFDNVAIGPYSLASVITEHSNVAIGSCALNATTGYANIGIGRFALLNSTASQNVAIGAEAGCCLTTHIRSTIIGSYAAKNIQASSNTIVGFCALGLATGGDCNTVVGTCAMLGSSSTTGYGNTAVGNCAAFSLTTGRFNVAVGDDAFKCNQTGICNVAMGNLALKSYTGSCNTALGSRALELATGSGNTAVGFRVLGSVSTGVRNIGVGFEAGLSMTTGTDNTVMGSAALFNNVSGNANTAVGRQALSAVTGSDNTGLGFYAGYNLTTGSNNIVIGKYTDASAATVSNEITLGNTSHTRLRIPGLNFNIDTDGIKFNGDTAAANALDDYEEGTWTPSATFANDTASGQAGAYTKVGNMVVATFQIVFSTTSFGINIALSGLPFTSNSTTGNASGASIGFYNGTSTTLQLYLAENSSQLNLRDIDGDIQHNSTKVLGKTLRGVVVYRTA